jgi:aldehyde dehydrogenase (NAD+)
VATDIKHYQMFINGKHVDSDESDQIRDPATEEVHATIARGTADHADAAVAAARAAFESGSWSRLIPCRPIEGDDGDRRSDRQGDR